MREEDIVNLVLPMLLHVQVYVLHNLYARVCVGRVVLGVCACVCV